MDFIRELLEADKDGKKKKVGRSTRRAVYHADYVKTKNRPYRKYHSDQANEGMEWEMEDEPMDDQDQQQGGEMDQDFDAQMGGEGEPEGEPHGEEMPADHGAIMSELERIIGELSELLSQFDAAEGGEGGEAELPPEEQPEEYPEEEPGAEAAMAGEEQPQEEPRFSPQFSSWLQRTSGVPLKEWGNSAVAARTMPVGRSVPAPSRDEVKKQAAEKVRAIAKHFGPGSTIPGALETFKQLTMKHHKNGGKHGERIYNIVTKHLGSK